jgi:ring-1,2-phenylacetyl-CoA epoxidase subunit PaaE
MQFFPLKVSSIRQETDDCVSVAVQVPLEWQGQFCYTAGQYLTFRAILQGEEVHRSYSICSSPLDQEWRVAIKKVEGGKFSSFTHTQLKVGDTLDVAPPQGRFGSQIRAKDTATYLAFAAGSGVTPILSILKTVLQTQPHSRFILVYGNQSRSSIIFKAELEALKNRFMGRLSIQHVLSREQADTAMLSGRIDAEKCQFILQKLIPLAAVDQYFICGPEEMIHTLRQTLLDLQVAPQKIHFELFGVKKSAATPTSPQYEGLKSKVKIRLDGSTFEVPVAYDGESVLEVALRSGADLPFACKGGVCCTCRAKVLSGEVQMQVNYGLEPDELAAGFVLTCQSHPRSSEILIDFDAK